MTIPYAPRGLAYLPSPLSRLRRQLSQRESQAGLSAAVSLIAAGLGPRKLPRCCGDFYRLPVSLPPLLLSSPVKF